MCNYEAEGDHAEFWEAEGQELVRQAVPVPLSPFRERAFWALIASGTITTFTSTAVGIHQGDPLKVAMGASTALVLVFTAAIISHPPRNF